MIKSIPVTLRLFLACAAVVAICSAAGAAPPTDPPLYLDSSQPREARVSDLLSHMTLDEKVSLVHGDSSFTTPAIPRLGIPRRWMSDGPHGVREEISPDSWRAANRSDDYSTWMPVGINLAATWDPDAAQAEGTAIGQEALKRGKQIMLGPAINIMRTPLNGRNYEYFGEDPYLAGQIAVGYIHGVQSQGVASCVKHFAANNQETQRTSIDVEMDDRTLYEIYLPAFKAAVQEGGAWAVMSAYNKFRGQYCSENDLLLNTILKGQWGFQGLVMSDWSAVHDTRGAATVGVDLEMGTNKPFDQFYLAQPYSDGLQQATYPMSVLNDKVRRNLREMFAVGVFDSRPTGSINTPEHQATARRIAEEGIVLLKNEKNALPLDAAQIKSIAVIGDDAVSHFAYGGQSAAIKTLFEITPLDGLLKRAGGQVDITFSQGYKAPVDRRGYTGQDPALLDRAVRAASQADVAIVVAGLDHSYDSEGTDRPDMKLPYGQDELIRRVAQANPRTIVVVMSGGPTEMPWLAQVPAVVQAWYPGMEGGNALAAILFGDVNPSGKLPCTFPQRLADSPTEALGTYPGRNGVERYTEGLLVGYRWFDTKNIAPLFPFGHGLSYTTFKYSALRFVPGQAPGSPVTTVKFEVTNTGARAGAEVAQVYVHEAHPNLSRPEQELKGFRRISLMPGATQTVSVPLGHGAFAYYAPGQSGWVAQKDNFDILVGSSSRDIRLKGAFRLDKTIVEKITPTKAVSLSR